MNTLIYRLFGVKHRSGSVSAALCIVCCTVLLAAASGQSPVPVKTDAGTASNSETEVVNPRVPEDARVSRTPSGPSLLGPFEGGLSLQVLAFGLVVVILQYLQSRNRDFNAQDTLRTYTITLILIGTLFVIAAGFDSEQIAPAMGLFGTIAGYLLGKSDVRRTDATPPVADRERE